MSTQNGARPNGRGFPGGFLWGVATAAYQIEGAVSEGGRGPSIWDTFSHTPGKIARGDTGDIACDGYHRLEGDLDLVAELGVGAYRFSVAWPRVQPGGSGAANEEGLDYYRRLVDGLGERGIEPVVTLYHWDLPQPLEDAGGWPRRETAERFADYAALVAGALGGRVRRWITLNEPWVAATLGYRWGMHAPGRSDAAAASASTHHLLLAHGLALQSLRATLPAGCEVGITLDMAGVRALDEEVRAVAEQEEATRNWIFLDPVLTGSYPTTLSEPFRVPAQLVEAGDMATISAPIDFLGLNYYTSANLRRRELAEELLLGEERLRYHPEVVSVVGEGTACTATGWRIDPDGLYELLVALHKRAPGLPLYVTENGMAAEDYADPEGGIDDVERIAYLRDHLEACGRAIEEGVDLRGYFCWSLLDNFEWAAGYQKRFGLVYVDYPSQRRIPKQSARLYAEVARSNRLPPPG